MSVADPPPDLVETVGGTDGWNAMIQMFVLAEQEQWEEAAGVIRDAPEICHFANFLMACAEVARESGDTRRALEYYGGLLRWGATRSLAHYNLGRLAEARGDEATALEHYRALLLRTERADTRIPQFEWARPVRGGLRRRTGRLTAASGGLVDRPRRRPGAARHGASVRGQEAAPPTRPTR